MTTKLQRKQEVNRGRDGSIRISRSTLVAIQRHILRQKEKGRGFQSVGSVIDAAWDHYVKTALRPSGGVASEG